MMTPPIRFAILGFGSFAERTIAPALRATPGAELVAIQKRSGDRAREKALEHRIPLFFDSVAEAVAHPDVDAVFIVSANGAHCAETIAAAEAGKHVLVEKPMALNVREAEHMIAACARHTVTLMVGHMIRFSPLVNRMRDILASGALGQVIYAKANFIYDARLSHRTWLYDRHMAGGGPVFDIGIHCIDTLRYVLGDEVTETLSLLEPMPTDARTEDSAQISLRFSRGTIGSVYCSYAAPVRRKQIEIQGAEGSLRAEDFTVGSQTTELVIDLGTEARPGRLTTEQITVPNLYVEEIAHFCDCIRFHRQPLTPGENGLANQRILDRAMERM
jgi:1,5-anhydro-D-fructose reductase (1,5-anhydro-D-mannitol-forming)